MIIGVPSEVKNNENRVGLTPDSARKIVASGHDVLIQKDAGANIGFFDEQYLSAGAKILDSGEDVYKSSEMIVKVKEPIPEEYPFLRDDLTLFTYLHLAGDPENAKKLMKYLTSEYAQEYYTNNSFEYPVNTNVNPSNIIAEWGEFKIDNLDLNKLGSFRKKAVEIFEKSNWN